MKKRYCSTMLILSVLLNPLLAQQNESVSARHRSFEEILAPRQVQYWPESDGIVCIDGTHQFSRTLYCPIESPALIGVETSDYPEFGLVLPGNGGNLRFDIEHTQVRTSYDGMSREYKLTLPVSMRQNSKKEAYVLISAYALQLSAAGGIWQIEGRNVKSGVKMQMRYGAVTGKQEQDYSFSLDRCVGNSYKVDAHGSFFEVSYGQGATLRGQVSPAIRLKLIEGKSGRGEKVQYLTASIPLDKPSIIALCDRTKDGSVAEYNLQTLLFESESKANALVADYELDTPDPLLNPLEYVLPAAAFGESLRPHESLADLSYVDGLLHKMNWDGNLDELRQQWPFIQEVLSKAKLMGDPDNDGLYRACSFSDRHWDDSQLYGDAAVTSSSVLAMRVNRQASRLARLLGDEALSAQYEAESELIQKAISDNLWMEQEGAWAEYREAYGYRRLQRHPALWTISQSIASEVGTPEQRFRATRYVDICLPRYEIRINNHPRCPYTMDNKWGELFSTSDWQPAVGSSNSVSVAEEMQMALAYWQIGRKDEAYNLFRSALSEGMYLGNTPGNLSRNSYYDTHSSEMSRDDGNAIAWTTRALMEGLMGMRPDLLNGILTIRPGFPSSWEGKDVAFSTPDFELRRCYRADTAVWYFMGQGDFFDRYDSIVVQVPAKSALAGELADKVGIRWEKSDHQPNVTSDLRPKTVRTKSSLYGDGRYTDPSTLDQSRLVAIPISKRYNLKVADIFHQKYSYKEDKQSRDKKGKNVGASGHLSTLQTLQQPIVEISDAMGLKAAFTSLWKNFPDKLQFKLPKTKKPATRLYLKMVGTTNALQSHMRNGIVRVCYADGSTTELALENPVNWWPIDQELAQGLPSFYLQRGQSEVQPPYRMSLRTGQVYRPNTDGVNIPTDGGAATLLELPLDPNKKLKSLELECLSNGVVIGIIEAWLEM